MAKQTLNIGTTANDGTGTTLRDGGDLINDNFNEIYSKLGDGSSLYSLTFPNVTDTVVGKATTDTFTNKTINGPDNTLTNIANTSLANSSITVLGDSGSDGISLGETFTLTGGAGITTAVTSNTITISASGSTEIVNDTTPQLGGTLDTNGNNIDFGDGDRARFGAGNDLQIYHTGSSSNIQDSGTGNLNISADELVIYNAGASEKKAEFTSNGSVDLYYDNSKKFETTSAGATVTGALTISGDLTVNGTTTTVNSTNTTLDDNLLELNSGATSNANDSGIIIERGSTGNNAIIMWDESADKFTLGTTTATADSTGNISVTTGTLVANIEGNVTGNVTGNASTATALATGRTIGMTGDVVWTSASFDGSGNVTGTATIQAGVISSTELASASTLLIKDSAGTTLKTVIGAGV